MTNASPVLILIGAPAAGKGTLSAPFIADGFMSISTGDMLREEVKKRSPLGLEAAAIMQNGGLVSDNIIIGMVRERMQTTPATGYIFDGFPRTVPQAIALDALLAERGLNNVHVLRLDVDDANLISRVEKRYNDAIAAGQTPRADDNPETFAKRLAAYRDYSAKVSAYYGDRLMAIDGNNGPEQTLKAAQRVTGISFPPTSPQGQANSRIMPII